MTNCKYTALLLVGLFSCMPLFSAKSQILNVEELRINPDSTNYFAGQLSAAFNFQDRTAKKNNPNKITEFKATSNLAFVGKKNLYLLLSNLDFQAISGMPVVRTGYFHGRTTFGWKKKLAYEAFLQFQYDLGRGLTERWLGGGGLRWNVHRGTKWGLHLGTGLMEEHEVWNPINSDQPSIVKDIPKSSNYVSFNTQFNGLMRYYWTVYYQTGYDEEAALWRNRVSTEIKLAFQFNKKLAFFTKFGAAYDDIPILPIRKYFYYINNGISINF